MVLEGLKKTIIAIMISCVAIMVMGFFFMPIVRVSWLMSPAEEYEGWQFFIEDSSVSCYLFNVGISHQYIIFMSENGTKYPCQDNGYTFKLMGD